METEYIIIDDKNIDKKAIDKAGEIIKIGGLVAFKTETVYGLGGDGLNPMSSKKIYAAKGRPSDNPLIIHIAEMSALNKIVKDIPEAAKKLADKFWPGPLTMIFNKSDIVPYETTGGLDTVAVRMPSDKSAMEFIKAAGGYVAAPSANLSGRPSPTTALHVKEDLDGRIDMILDAGSCDIGLESTIVDLTEEIPMVLRPGYISREMVEDVLGRAEYDPGIISSDSNIKPKAPGMKYRHYAPKGELVIIKGDKENVVEYIQAQISEKKKAGKTVGVIATEETYESYKAADMIANVGARDDEEAIANHLYSVLRDFDEKNIDYIFSEDFNTPRIGHAIMNRLMKAAGQQVIDCK